MRPSSLRSAALACLLIASAGSTALAQGLPPPPPTVVMPGSPAAPSAPLPPNIVTHPDGTVSVQRTPEEGVDVHAQTGAGAVHAYGCSRVDVDPSARTPMPASAPPCPLARPAYPYPYAAPSGYAAPPPPAPLPLKPRYAPDPGRRAALIASSIVFGLGTVGAGVAYAVSTIDVGSCQNGLVCRAEPSKPALYALGANLTITPSIPRFVVGDYGYALLFAALRGGSFAAGTMIDWKDKTYFLPVTLAFIAPLTLGIVDLATTPHREQLMARRAQASASPFQLQGLGPTVAHDVRNQPMPAFGAFGTF